MTHIPRRQGARLYVHLIILSVVLYRRTFFIRGFALTLADLTVSFSVTQGLPMGLPVGAIPGSLREPGRPLTSTNGRAHPACLYAARKRDSSERRDLSYKAYIILFYFVAKMHHFNVDSLNF